MSRSRELLWAACLGGLCSPGAGWDAGGGRERGGGPSRAVSAGEEVNSALAEPRRWLGY